MPLEINFGATSFHSTYNLNGDTTWWTIIYSLCEWSTVIHYFDIWIIRLYIFWFQQKIIFFITLIDVILAVDSGFLTYNFSFLAFSVRYPPWLLFSIIQLELTITVLGYSNWTDAWKIWQYGQCLQKTILVFSQSANQNRDKDSLKNWIYLGFLNGPPPWTIIFYLHSGCHDFYMYWKDA